MGKYLNESLEEKLREGQIGYSKNGDLMKIVEYHNYKTIVVEFQDEFKHRLDTQYVNFLSGSCKNPYHLSVYGYGYFGVGPHVSEKRVDGKRVFDKSYRIWKAMIGRIGNRDGKHPGYIDCDVCEEWRNFQVFADWYYDKYYMVGDEQMQLDKDILIPGNKIYSPETCCIVPERINELVSKIYTDKENKLPPGVRRRNDSLSEKYRSVIIYRSSYKGETKVLSKTFDSIKDAYAFYKSNKERLIHEVAEEYKGRIPNNVYTALRRYQIPYKL